VSSKPPPVPPANRSDKGPGADPVLDHQAKTDDRSPPSNLKEQDRQGNIKQNTTHQGYQQDR